MPATSSSRTLNRARTRTCHDLDPHLHLRPPAAAGGVHQVGLIRPDAQLDVEAADLIVEQAVRIACLTQEKEAASLVCL